MSKKAKQPKFKVGDKVKVQFTEDQRDYIHSTVGFCYEMHEMNGKIFEVVEAIKGNEGSNYTDYVGLYNEGFIKNVYFPHSCLTHDIEDKPTKKETKPKAIKHWFLVDKITGDITIAPLKTRKEARLCCEPWEKVVKGYITLEE
jgi:hypothetical protein